MSALSEGERKLMRHVTMWGSDGYPIVKLGRRWTWDAAGHGACGGPPGPTFSTKRAAVASFEAYYASLVERSGEEAFERAFAEYAARRVAEGATPEEAERLAWEAVAAARAYEAAKGAA